MGELTKRRAARDLWVSRGHVKAALVGAFLLSGVSFGLGYITGLGGGNGAGGITGFVGGITGWGSPTPTRSTAWAAEGFAEQVPGEDLVALLARVEANQAVLGGVDSLTFPEELSRAAHDVPVGPVAPPELLAETTELLELHESMVEPGPAVRIAADHAKAPDLPSPPVGSHTLQIATLESEASARTLAQSLGGCVEGGEGCAPALEGLTPWIGATIVDGELLYTVSLGGFGSEAAAMEALEGVRVLPDTRGASVQPIP